MLVPFERLHRAYKGQGLAAAFGGIDEPQERIRYTVDFIEQITGLTGVGEYLTLLLELDFFFLNEDRHTNNLAVIRNEKTKEFRLCPNFDNSLPCYQIFMAIRWTRIFMIALGVFMPSPLI